MSESALFLGGTKGLGLELARLAIGEGISATIAGRTAADCSLVRERKAKGVSIDLGSSDPSSLSIAYGAYDLLVWTAGVHAQGSFISSLPQTDFWRVCRTHLEGPIDVLTRIFSANCLQKRPCHLVVVGSTSSYRTRDDEALYGALKAAKAHLARNLGRELPREIPGSKVLLANPGGMATPFWEGREEKAVGFMDPAVVARVLWAEVRRQESSFLEIQILRQPDRSPKVEYGPRMPE
ncbi:MAG: SDR family NAD(P)-dependent oxidoreductase [Patescibacteria group bacterium]